MSPLVGISGRLFDHPPYRACGVRMSYVDAITTAGGVPVLIPLNSSLSAVEHLFHACDCLLLPGGEDVHPKYYGEAPHEKLGEVSELRDEVELFLIKQARETRKPILAICRGIQVLNVQCGGTLYQDIPAQLPKAATHRDADPDSMWQSEAHDVHLTSASLLASILGATAIGVNSIHHQAVKDLGAGLTVSGVSADGVIEAIEGTDPGHFVVGVQWHPETMWQAGHNSAKWRALFKAFVDAGSASKQKRV